MGIEVNQRLFELAKQASKDVDLVYQGDAFTVAFARNLVKDLIDEFSKVKWMGNEEGWDKAIEAVKKHIKERYGI
jgi:hypothetical protein